MTSPAIQPSSAAPAQTRIGSLFEQRHDQGGACDDQGDADGKAEDQQRHAAVGGGGHRDHIVEAHDDVGDHDDPDCRPTDATPTATPSSSSCSGTRSFAAITISARPPTSFRYGSAIRVATMPVKMMRSTTAAAGAEDHAPQSLFRRQSAARQRNHQRVVAGQQHVDPDDLADRDPERRLRHLALELGDERSDVRRIEDLATASSQRFLSALRRPASYRLCGRL